MIAGLVTNSTTVTVTPPAGWVLVTSILNGTNVTTRVYRKLAGGSEPASYLFGYSFNVKSAVAVSAYTGVDPTTPVEVFGSGTNASLLAQLAPSVTTLSANAQVVRVWGVKKETTLSPPAGVTERADTSSTGTGSVTVAIGDVAQPAVGASGTATATSASVGFGAHITLALKPAPGGGSTTTTQRYSFGAVLNTSGVVLERSISLPGGVSLTKRGGGDVWSYPNIHGDVQATANAAGVKQGATLTYDPYGQPLTAIVDNSAGNIDNAWLGQHNKQYEHETGLKPLIEMGARPYDPVLGRFLSVDPVAGGCSNSYNYGYGDPMNSSDLDGQADCGKIAQKIRDFLSRDKRKHGNSGTHGMIHRQADFFKYGANWGPRQYWTHVSEFNNARKNLQKRLKEFKDGKCKPPPKGPGGDWWSKANQYQWATAPTWESVHGETPEAGDGWNIPAPSADTVLVVTAVIIGGIGTFFGGGLLGGA
jgi:RHS repeat-associated protein